MSSEKRKQIKVLIVDDSSVIRQYLTYILENDPEIKVIGTAEDGEKALEILNLIKPDVITMDIHMPNMDGFTATRKIMETNPLPIVMVSGSASVDEVSTTFLAMESGALAAVQRPKGINDPEHEASVNELIKTVKLMSEIKVIKRWGKVSPKPNGDFVKNLEMTKESHEIKIIGIGASTGGPIVLKTILSGLGKDFPVPILIVQHIAVGFVAGFADWLSQQSNFPVYLANQEESMVSGNAYVAPDGFNMGVSTHDKIFLAKDLSKNGHCPSVSYLFQSIANVYGQNSIGVLLTGMGKDGAGEMKMIKDNGGVTIAQNAESSIVFGMPGEAIKLDAVDYILSPEEIPTMLKKLVRKTI